MTYASLTRRGSAAAVDLLLIAGISLVLLPLLGQLDALGVESALPFLVIGFVYSVGFEWLFEATVGKLVTGIRVVQTDGTKCSLNHALIRNVLRVLDFLPAFYVLGIFVALRSDRKQRLGDRIAGTVVARHPVPKPSPPPAPFLFH
jgi:uncharacterized RDD family membrane protein YckC